MMFWSKIEYGSNRSIAGKARASCKVASAWWEHQSDWVPVAGFAQAERWAWAWEGTSHDSRDADQGFLPAIWLWFICSALCFQPVQYFWVFACKCLMHLAMQSLGPRLKPSFGSLAFQMKTARMIQQALAGGALWQENSPIVSRWVWRWKQQRVWLPTRRPSSILGDHCGGGLQALTNGPGGSGGAGPSLEQLVSVMNNQISAKAAAKAKAKSKAKAKANPALQAAKTPAEIREAHRDLANAMILLFLSFCRFQWYRSTFGEDCESLNLEWLERFYCSRCFFFLPVFKVRTLRRSSPHVLSAWSFPRDMTSAISLARWRNASKGCWMSFFPEISEALTALTKQFVWTFWVYLVATIDPSDWMGQTTFFRLDFD